MSVRISIQQGGGFEEINARVSDLVFWRNDDTRPHTPCGLDVDPGMTSSALQPVKNDGNAFRYTCTTHGEAGVVNLFGDFAVKNTTVNAPAPPTDPIPVATGGKSPYAMSAADVTPSGISLTLVETAPAGSNSGISAVIANPPAGSFTVTFTLNAADSLDNNLDQQTVTITYKA